ncbi:YqaJ viral recombinase family protein, partial [Lactobacillus johnsonii]|uniref:YqaJ viral recombinase family protein n=1 Tax=Lactobacillus johnsonii TaxID=33959 RepID=UPI00201A5778
MLSKYNGELYQKNEERFSNDYITGLPDIITTDTIIDVKTCQDIWTFHDKVGESIPDLYYAQIQAYLWLTGRT